MQIYFDTIADAWKTLEQTAAQDLPPDQEARYIAEASFLSGAVAALLCLDRGANRNALLREAFMLLATLANPKYDA